MIRSSAFNKSKMGYFTEIKPDWEPNKREKYMDELTRKQVSAIFKARTRMLKVKNNYKNGYRDLKCRARKIEIETQCHILEACPAIHENNSKKVSKEQLASGDTNTLRETAKRIISIFEKLENVY